MKDAPESLRRQAREAAEAGCRLEWVEAVLAVARPGTVSDEEWATICRVMTTAEERRGSSAAAEAARDEPESTRDRLTDPDAVDCVCQRWIETGDSALCGLIASGGYVARRPVAARVRTALLTEAPLTHLADDGPEIVAPLLDLAAGTDADRAAKAGAVLAEHPSPEVRAALFRAALENADSTASRLVRERGLVPADPDQRALLLFLTGDWPAYKASDPDRTHLRAALEPAPEALRRRIEESAESGRRLEWVEAVLGGPQLTRLAQVTTEEWAGLSRLLAAVGRWADLWVLARYAPLEWSLEFLKVLAGSGWQPKPEHRPVFEALTQLAGDCDRSSWETNLPIARGRRFPSSLPCAAASPSRRGAT